MFQYSIDSAYSATDGVTNCARLLARAGCEWRKTTGVVNIKRGLCPAVDYKDDSMTLQLPQISSNILICNLITRPLTHVKKTLQNFVKQIYLDKKILPIHIFNKTRLLT